MQIVFFTLLCLFIGGMSPSYGQLAGYQDIHSDDVFDMPFIDKDGKEHSFKEFPGKIVLVNFWAPYCGPCLKEMPSINNLPDTFTSDELSVVTICTDVKFKDQAQSTFHLNDYKNLSLFFDHKNTLLSKVKARGIPLTLILNQERKIIGRLDGATEWDHYENLQLLSDLVAGKVFTKPPTFFEKLMAWFKK